VEVVGVEAARCSGAGRWKLGILKPYTLGISIHVHPCSMVMFHRSSALMAGHHGSCPASSHLVSQLANNRFSAQKHNIRKEANVTGKV
jgi:hypothetical protein